jgi:hypothetical protein
LFLRAFGFTSGGGGEHDGAWTEPACHSGETWQQALESIVVPHASQWKDNAAPPRPREIRGRFGSSAGCAAVEMAGAAAAPAASTSRQGPEFMLKLSEILVANKDIESFDELTAAVQEVARQGERFFRMDVKPPFPDTPDDWEDRLEAAFSGLIR